MKTTNKFGVPDALVRFLERDTYSRGASRISVTQLINSPRIVLLTDRHTQDIEVDVADQLWLLLGKAIHHVIERGTENKDGTTTEERVFAKIHGWTVSGQIDLQEEDGGLIVRDWKFTSVWSVVNGKDEWVEQLNSYADLLRRNGRKVKRLEVVAFLRDWNRRDAEKDGYPKAPIIVVPVTLWPPEKAASFCEERVMMHQKARVSADFDEDLPLCTDKDRWIRPSKWLCMKPGAERPVRVFDTKAEAEEHCKSKPGLSVVERRSPATRCEEFCNVSGWCSQWKSDPRRGSG